MISEFLCVNTRSNCQRRRMYLRLERSSWRFARSIPGGVSGVSGCYSVVLFEGFHRCYVQGRCEDRH
ncbi:unnamed protein product [Linum trigynum]|uniref:Uncharacterized protein n=1 Tax=Linum trigynum TaxID=586398 RepID=A0AAV2CK92_9ROSI